MSSHSWLVVLLGGCLWFGASSAYAQKPRAVVMDFEGNGGAKARAQVVRALRDQAELEPRSEAKKVLSAENAKVSSVSGRAAIAEDLGLDYVIWGRVRGRGSAARAEIRIAGPKGKQITERKAGPPGQSKGNERIRKAARAALAKAMEVAPAKRQAKRVEPIVVEDIELSLIHI